MFVQYTIVTVLTSSQWVLDTTSDRKKAIVIPNGEAMRVTMKLLRSRVVSKTHWERVRTVTMILFHFQPSALTILQWDALLRVLYSFRY